MSTTINLRKAWTQDSFAKTVDKNGVVTDNQTSKQTLRIDETVTKEGPVSKWREKISRGQSATTPLQGTRYMANCPDGFAGGTITSTKNVQTMHGDIGRNLTASSFPSPLTSLSTAADNVARSRLLSQYLKARNTWRGGNFLAELRDTIHMVKHPLDSIYRRSWDYVGKLGKLKNVNRQKPLWLPKALADAWLAYIFGVKPLADDVADGITAVRKVLGPYRQDRMFVKASGSSITGSVTRKTGENVGLYVFPVDFDTIRKDVSTVKYYGQLGARPDQAAASLEQFGVSPFDAIPAVWEAVTFSFVVDYFANVAEVLDGFRLWNADCLWLNRGVRNIRTVLQGSVKLKPQASYGGTDFVNYSGSSRTTRYVSRAGVAFPHPNFYFKMPGLQSLKWLNLAALLSAHSDVLRKIEKGA